MEGGKVLARYEQSAREFLYPTPTLTGKDGMDRELLLSRTVHFTVSGQEPLWIIYTIMYVPKRVQSWYFDLIWPSTEPLLI